MPDDSASILQPAMTGDQWLYQYDSAAREIIQAFVTASSLGVLPGLGVVSFISQVASFRHLLLTMVIFGSGGVLWVGYLQIVRGRAWWISNQRLWIGTALYNTMLVAVFIGLAHAEPTLVLWGWMAALWPLIATLLAGRMIVKHWQYRALHGT